MTSMIWRGKRKVSRSGALAVRFSACRRLNSGESSRRMRMKIAIAPSGPAMMNGMRQPQSCMASAPRAQAMPLPTRAPIIRPEAAVVIRVEVARPRPPFLENSETKAAMVEISPPAEKPWTMRRKTSRTGAMTPIEWAVGSRPMHMVAPHMTPRTIMRVLRRPILSASGPKNRPPSGRMKKERAKTAKAESRPTTGSSEMKKLAPTYTARKP
ncbi:hypothetical protein HMPREF2863_03995 [Micrococcus sp. HMSC067E09]|nr:hypothetical protein HMPREF2863_03995 [Micrococcus sp. HMSC067E09]